MHRSQRASLLIAALGAASTVVFNPGPARSQGQSQPNTATPAGDAAQTAAPSAPAAGAPAATAPTARLLPATPAQKPPVEIGLFADQQGFDLMANRYVAVGQVRAMLAGGRLLADRLEYDTATRTLYASGRVRFQRGNHYLQASRLRYSLIENSGEVEEVYGVLDLDSAALDLNPEAIPSAALLPLSDWARIAPAFALPITLLGPSDAAEPSNAAPTTTSTRPAASTAAAINAAEPPPLLDAETLRQLPPAARFSGSTEPSSGPVEPLPQDRWRMPPVALTPAAQTMACPPPLPPLPNWHPHPWTATAWGGQMIDANFGDTFLFQGDLRPEYLLGVGLNRRLLRAGPLALEFDSNALLHRAASQPGGGFNQSEPFANTPAQTFGEFTWGFGLRAWLQPWLSLGFVEGVSLNTNVSNYEKTFREKYTTFLNYLGFEVEALVAPQWSLVGRIHHRSGAYGTYSGVSEGSNAYLIGLRKRFGSDAPQRFGVAMAPANGCPGSGSPARQRPRPLDEQLNQVALGSPQQATGTPHQADAGPGAGTNRSSLPLTPSQQERQRREAIAATVDQRVSNLQFQQSLSADRRLGVDANDYQASATEVAYGAIRPVQLQPLLTKENRQMVNGTISRWRMQANRIRVTPQGWSADRAALSNDPYTPAQSWVDAEGLVAHLEPNGDLVLQAQRNQLILEDRLPIPLRRNQRFEKDAEVENRWVLGTDGEDRDGLYLGYNLRPIGLRGGGNLTLQPQFMVRRALDGVTSSYVLPGQPIGASPSSQPTRVGDLFGLLAKLQTKLLGFKVEAIADLSTFDPSNFANGARSWGDIRRSFDLPLLGQLTARGFAAYRFRVWNGSLGEQDVYSAVGVSLEQQRELPPLGRLTNQVFWRAGVGQYQGTDFASTNLADLWRANLFASLNSRLPLWTGRALPPGPESATRFSPVPIVPGLVLNTNTSVNLSAYGNGTSQNLLSLSGGPTLTLGHLQRNWFDYTQLTITGGGTLREGKSPFSFDRAVDLGTLGIGLTQQLVGPLLFSGGIGLNVDPRSQYYGDTVGSYVELRWQRRAYELAVYYSPYEQIGGIRIKLNDFNFSGTGVPFVPYNPVNTASDAGAIERRGF